MDNSKTIFESRYLSHNLLQRVQKAKSKSIQQPSKGVRPWIMSAGFPNFCPHFQLRVNWSKPDMVPQTIPWEAPLLVRLPPPCTYQQPPKKAYLNLSYPIKRFHLLPAFASLPNAVMVADSFYGKF